MARLTWDVVVATDLEHEHLPADHFALADELPLLAALEVRGLRACRVPWNRPAFAWESTALWRVSILCVRVCVRPLPFLFFIFFIFFVRSPLSPQPSMLFTLDRERVLESAIEVENLFRPKTATPAAVLSNPVLANVPAFVTWLDHVASVSRLFNPVATMKWNIDKQYLLELGDRGIALPPTVLVVASGAAAAPPSLAALIPADWAATGGAVIKPTVSAGADRTHRVGDAAAAVAMQSDWAALVTHRAMLIQQYQPRIASDGEISLIFIAGQFTHAILKRPAAGDFRVQGAFGGTSALYEPKADELAFARQVVAACPGGDPPCYARVDVVRSADDARVLLMEVELLEPLLWLCQAPHAVEALAAHLAWQLRAGSAPTGAREGNVR